MLEFAEKVIFAIRRLENGQIDGAVQTFDGPVRGLCVCSGSHTGCLEQEL